MSVQKIDPSESIYVAGHDGMVGSAIIRTLEAAGYKNFITAPLKELDLTNQAAVEAFFKQEHPDHVFVAAAKVGGILANDTYRAQFLYENLMISANVIHAAYTSGVKKLLFLGSSCIYPKMAPQPIKEEYLLTDVLEPTNEPYAISKIAAIKLCENYYRQYGANFISVMPTNLYGQNDNFNLESSHVIPALMRKFHEAKIANSDFVEIWGSGKPLREFLYVDDLAEACVFLMNKTDAKDIYSQGITQINIGAGKDIPIIDLAKMISEVVGYKGAIKNDATKPDGTPKKLLDISRIEALGWSPTISLRDGLATTYKWFLEHRATSRT